MNQPLAERIRPQQLSDYISQLHLVGPEGSLTQQIAKGLIPSLILWGPPGTGKTTLAQIMAQESKRPFYQLSAIHSGVKDIREVIEKAKQSSGLFTAKIRLYLLMRFIVFQNHNKILCWLRWKKVG